MNPTHPLGLATRSTQSELVGILLILLTLSVRLNAETNLIASPSELKHYSLEQLMNIEVTTVSRQAEPWFNTPSAIQVITSEDIRRSGATSLPEALRLAPNLQIAQADSSTCPSPLAASAPLSPIRCSSCWMAARFTRPFTPAF